MNSCDGMKTIVITAPDSLVNEAEACTALLEAGVWRLHIRKPESEERDVAALIEAIPQRFYPQLTLHDHLQLALRYGIVGLHFNARNAVQCGELLQRPDFVRSASCHSLEEVKTRKAGCEYVFLSPIFDSISKQGYTSKFSADVLRDAAEAGIIDEKVFALGGVSDENVRELQAVGFGGAAVLGCIWQPFKAAGCDVRSAVTGFEALRSRICQSS